jgi:hypothetical protein
MKDPWYEKIVIEGCPKCGDKDHLSLLSDETRRYPLRWDAEHQEIEYGPSEPWAEGDYDRILCGNCRAVIEE